MIFYRLALQRIIDYLYSDQPVKYEDPKSKKHKPYKTQLKTDKTLNLCISTLLSIISWFVCLSIPYAALESPCESLKEKNFHILYTIAKLIENYKFILDSFIVILLVLLVYVTTAMIVKAIKNTDISISPWVERGKYALPRRHRRKMPFYWL